MTTHPEDAMTRERALEEAAAHLEKNANRWGVSWAVCLHEAAKSIRALASAQQEPAPAVEVEGVSLTEASRMSGRMSIFEAGASSKDTTFVPPMSNRRPAALPDRLEEAVRRFNEIDEDGTFKELRSLCAEAAAALRRYAGDRGGPEGWQLVPVVPTKEMILKGQDAKIHFDNTPWKPGQVVSYGPIPDIWQVMLEAAARAKSGEKGT